MRKKTEKTEIAQEEATKFLAVGHKVFVCSSMSLAVRDAREILFRRGSTVLGPAPPKNYGEGVIVAIRVHHDLNTLLDPPHRVTPVFDVEGKGWTRMNLRIDDLELWTLRQMYEGK